MGRLMAQMVKNPPAVRETWVRSLGCEDPPGGGHDSPLQCSCLENRVVRGAWWATVHGVCRLSDTTKWITLSYFQIPLYA